MEWPWCSSRPFKPHVKIKGTYDNHSHQNHLHSHPPHHISNVLQCTVDLHRKTYHLHKGKVWCDLHSLILRRNIIEATLIYLSLLRVLTHLDPKLLTLSANLCRVKRYFKPYRNEHMSVKDTREKGKNLCNTGLKISMKILFHYSLTFPFIKS